MLHGNFVATGTGAPSHQPREWDVSWDEIIARFGSKDSNKSRLISSYKRIIFDFRRDFDGPNISCSNYGIRFSPGSLDIKSRKTLYKTSHPGLPFGDNFSVDTDKKIPHKKRRTRPKLAEEPFSRAVMDAAKRIFGLWSGIDESYRYVSPAAMVPLVVELVKIENSDYSLDVCVEIASGFVDCCKGGLEKKKPPEVFFERHKSAWRNHYRMYMTDHTNDDSGNDIDDDEEIIIDPSVWRHRGSPYSDDTTMEYLTAELRRHLEEELEGMK